MDARQIIEGAEETMTVKRVFGEPYERNGVTILPVAKVQGGAGMGGGESPGQGSGQGGGFALNARPVGVFVIRGDDVRWQPSLDLNRVILGGQVLALAMILAIRSIAKARAKKRR
jgi:uncharacterized spore protein YtfJ